MKNEQREELSPEFEIPSEQERKPVDEAGLYQRYWEERYRQEQIERQRNSRGLNIYERARGEDWSQNR
jgi:hypothetical protein